MIFILLCLCDFVAISFLKFNIAVNLPMLYNTCVELKQVFKEKQKNDLKEYNFINIKLPKLNMLNIGHGTKNMHNKGGLLTSTCCACLCPKGHRAVPKGVVAWSEDLFIVRTIKIKCGVTFSYLFYNKWMGKNMFFRVETKILKNQEHCESEGMF